MKRIKFFTENFRSKITNPHDMMIGGKYKITYPVYDDYNENLEPESDNVQIIQRQKNAFLVRDIENNIQFALLFTILMECDITEIE